MLSCFSMISRSLSPLSLDTGVVMISALSLIPLMSLTASSTPWSSTMSVLVRTIVPAYWIWFMKNSPKFFMYILHFLASTMVTAELSDTSRLAEASVTAFMTSESFPTPDGSIMILSASNLSMTSFRDFSKSPTSEQHMQPWDISLISMPESFKNPPSMDISPNSFSIRTIFSPLRASDISFLIKVVFPAPRNPETTSIFTTKEHLFYLNPFYAYG